MTKSSNISAAHVHRPIKRLRRWSAEIKSAILQEVLIVGALVSVVAQRHNIPDDIIFAWRRRIDEGIDHLLPTKGIPPTSEFQAVFRQLCDLQKSLVELSLGSEVNHAVPSIDVKEES